MTRVSVIAIATGEPGMLAPSVATALAQTVTDIEVLIAVGAGGDAMRAAADAVAGGDTRVSVTQPPPGGDHFIHAAIEASRGPLIAYLPAGSLWLPDHLEVAGALLADAAFASTIAVAVGADGSLVIDAIDLANAADRRALFEGRTLPAASVAHTRAAYDSLEEGWHPAPPWLDSDVHMWRHFAASPDLRMASGGRPTAVTFHGREDRDPSRSTAEVEEWSERLRTSEGPAALRSDAVHRLFTEGAALGRRIERVYDDNERLRRKLRRKRRSPGQGDRTAVKRARREARRSRRKLEKIQASISYRAAQRIASLPVVSGPARALGRLVLRRSKGERQDD